VEAATAEAFPRESLRTRNVIATEGPPVTMVGVRRSTKCPFCPRATPSMRCRTNHRERRHGPGKVKPSVAGIGVFIRAGLGGRPCGRHPAGGTPRASEPPLELPSILPSIATRGENFGWVRRPSFEPRGAGGFQGPVDVGYCCPARELDRRSTRAVAGVYAAAGGSSAKGQTRPPKLLRPGPPNRGGRSTRSHLHVRHAVGFRPTLRRLLKWGTNRTWRGRRSPCFALAGRRRRPGVPVYGALLHRPPAPRLYKPAAADGAALRNTPRPPGHPGRPLLGLPSTRRGSSQTLFWPRSRSRDGAAFCWLAGARLRTSTDS